MCSWNAFPLVEKLVSLFNASSVVKPYWLLSTLARLKAQVTYQISSACRCLLAPAYEPCRLVYLHAR